MHTAAGSRADSLKPRWAFVPCLHGPVHHQECQQWAWVQGAPQGEALAMEPPPISKFLSDAECVHTCMLWAERSQSNADSWKGTSEATVTPAHSCPCYGDGERVSSPCRPREPGLRPVE